MNVAQETTRSQALPGNALVWRHDPFSNLFKNDKTALVRERKSALQSKAEPWDSAKSAQQSSVPRI